MIWAWILFLGFVFVMLALDLGVFHRKSHVIHIKEALMWSAFWITLGLLFSIVVYFGYEQHWFHLGLNPDGSAAMDPADKLVNDGKLAATKYLTGYVVEKSLSVDNIFVIAMVFSSLAVRPRYQHRVLFWGILGALIMRGVMIGIGASLVTNFHWILYVFGAFLVFTAIKMLVTDEDEGNPADNKLVAWISRRFPVTRNYHGKHFLVKADSAASREAADPDEQQQADEAVEKARSGKWMLTPLAIALVLVEVTDLIFAVDSIPAIFAITADPFLVFTSNVFAILGLRSLYFALAGMISTFRYLKPALSLILFVVGVKMLALKWIKMWLGESTNLVVLGLIFGILAVGVIASICSKKKAAD
nr:TerC family protein [Luteolibacter pohnpeiensis]